MLHRGRVHVTMYGFPPVDSDDRTTKHLLSSAPKLIVPWRFIGSGTGSNVGQRDEFFHDCVTFIALMKDYGRKKTEHQMIGDSFDFYPGF